MTKAKLAKTAGWIGGLLTAIGMSGYLGPKLSPIAVALGALLTGSGIHAASDTSAGHPNGAVN